MLKCLGYFCWYCYLVLAWEKLVRLGERLLEVRTVRFVSQFVFGGGNLFWVSFCFVLFCFMFI